MSELDKQQISKFYDTVYYKAGDAHMIRPPVHYEKMLTFLRPLRFGGKLLDVGCGAGLFLSAAQRAGLVAYGVDISQRAVEIAKKAVPEATILQGSGEALPFPDTFFDYLFFGGTLEHFFNVDQGLEEAVRVAKNDATMLIVVPNKKYWLWMIRGIPGTHQSKVKELLLDYDGWMSLFCEHGIELIKVFQDPWPRDSVAIFKYKNPWRIFRRLVYHLIWLFIPLRKTYQFVFVCKKRM